MTGQNFKECVFCRSSWDTRESFLKDPKIVLVGYQINFKELRAGYFLFNHSCNATLALDVELFADLYQGPIFEQRRMNEPECPEYCLYECELRPCPNQCECAFVRNIIQIVRQYKLETYPSTF